MREILFRGKPTQDERDDRLDTPEWVYGSLVVEGSSYFIYIDIWESELEKVEVIPETVGEYTGIDMNGEKIFEGDIISWVDSDCDKRIDDVKYHNGSFILCNQNFSVWSYTGDSLKVVGNIYDDKGLLKRTSMLAKQS